MRVHKDAGLRCLINQTQAEWNVSPHETDSDASFTELNE